MAVADADALRVRPAGVVAAVAQEAAAGQRSLRWKKVKLIETVIECIHSVSLDRWLNHL